MSAFYYDIPYDSPTVISLEVAKKQLKMEDLGNFDNSLILDCIEAAIDEAENYINANIRERKYTLKATEWLDQNFEFPKQKVTSIDSVKYKDVDGQEQTLNSSLYELLPIDKYAAVFHIKDYDALPVLKTEINDAVTITLTVGYAATKVPLALRQAIKIILTDNYDFRGDNERKGITASRIKLEPYRYYGKP